MFINLVQEAESFCQVSSCRKAWRPDVDVHVDVDRQVKTLCQKERRHDTWYNDTWHNDTWHNDTWHNDSQQTIKNSINNSQNNDTRCLVSYSIFKHNLSD
jgi:hypothetical protein